MGMTDEDRARLKRSGVGTEALTVPLPLAPAATGLSRSAIYRAAAQGKIKLMKLGRSTLVDMASVRAFLASLPAAEIGGSKNAA